MENRIDLSFPSRINVFSIFKEYILIINFNLLKKPFFKIKASSIKDKFFAKSKLALEQIT